MSLNKEEIVRVLEVLAAMPEDDLVHAESIINSRKVLLKQMRVSNFQPGQFVRFPNRDGSDVSGRIKRVNRFTVLVDVGGKTLRAQVDQMQKVNDPETNVGEAPKQPRKARKEKAAA